MNKSTRICVVEDSKLIRQRLNQVINSSENLYCIATYENAEIAFTELLTVKPDIVIMDIGLPGMNGIECMLKVKNKNPNIAFLIFTVFDNNEYIFDALKAGASGYILKDEKPQGVVAAINEYLEGGGPMSSEIAKKVMDSFHKYGPAYQNDEKLTSHQIKILKLISDGLLNKEIADNLKITIGSVKVQISRIYKKLHVNNRIEAMNKYMKLV